MKNIFNKIRKRIFGLNILDLYENGSEYLNERLLNDCILNNPSINYMGQKIQIIESLGHLRPIAAIILNGSNEKRIVVDNDFFRMSETLQKFFINHEMGHIHDENFMNNPETGFELILDSSLEITADNYSFKTLSKKELKEVYNKIFKPLHKFYKSQFQALMKINNLTDEERSSIKLENKVIMDRYINILKYL